ncbi:MAG: lytic transglycosylase domain-containing protein [Bacteroidota bacterium]
MNKVKVMLLLSIGVLLSSRSMTAATMNDFTLDFKSKSTTSATYSEAEIKANVLNSQHILSNSYDASVQHFVKDNLYYGRKGFAKTIGRTMMYFPVVERYLKMYDLPDDLKHMVIVESHADPHATSHCGAKGLWQMMPETARRFGLVVNANQDDRKDPRKSTEAALRYMTFLYNSLNKDWTLAIAAYNCGEGRVRKAVRQANSWNYNKLKQFLPTQTQKYIPAIMAAGYSVENYAKYGVRAAYTPYTLRFTNTVKVFDRLSFAEIANSTNTPIETVRKLNPSYQHGFVPSNKKGNYVVLPSISSNQLSNHLKRSNRYAVSMRF